MQMIQTILPACKLCFKKIGSPYILVNCSWRKKGMIKSNTSLKRWFWVEENKALKNFQNIRKWRWKMKMQKMKIFYAWPKYFIIYCLKLWTSQIWNMYSDFSYISLIKSYSPSKLVHFACFWPLLAYFEGI